MRGRDRRGGMRHLQGRPAHGAHRPHLGQRHRIRPACTRGRIVGHARLPRRPPAPHDAGAATRTGTAGYAATCPGKPFSRSSPTTNCRPSSRRSMTPRWNSSATKHPTRFGRRQSRDYHRNQPTQQEVLHSQIESGFVFCEKPEEYYGNV